MLFGRFLCVLGCAAAVGAAAPSTLAAPVDQHRGGGHGGNWQQGGNWQGNGGWRDGGHWRGDHWSRNRGFVSGPVVIEQPAVVPVPFPVAAPPPAVIPVPVPVPVAAPPPAAVPVPVPVPAIQSAILPPLQQAFPAAGFPQNPPQILPLQSNTYAVSSPALFCGVDQAGTCQLMAQQLAQITPGWGTTVMNGPEGYGVYLTYQPV
jgi:hypothetical protein